LFDKTPNRMKRLLTTLFAMAAFAASAQYDENDSNRIGISVGVNQFTMNSSDFDTKPGIGWNAGLSVRGNFYNDFDMVYDIRFSEHKFLIEPASPLIDDVETKVQSAQISVLLSYKLIENHLSVEFGPMFQFNGKLDYDEQDELTVIDGAGTTMKDIEEIPLFNFYPTVGITGGVTHVRLHLFAQYGVTNMFRGLEDAANGSIKGNGMVLGANLCFYL
jgi:hypothetical protein